MSRGALALSLALLLAGCGGLGARKAADSTEDLLAEIDTPLGKEEQIIVEPLSPLVVCLGGAIVARVSADRVTVQDPQDRAAVFGRIEQIERAVIALADQEPDRFYPRTRAYETGAEIAAFMAAAVSDRIGASLLAGLDRSRVVSSADRIATAAAMKLDSRAMRQAVAAGTMTEAEAMGACRGEIADAKARVAAVLF